MFKGYLEFGGNEVGNSARAYGYASTANCPARWIRNPDLKSLNAAVGDGPYTHATIETAPWYDSDEPDLSSRFYGLSVLDIRGLPDSTREASVTQKNGPGAQVSGYRHAAREVRVRGWLTAAGEDALEAGMTWLRNVLEPDACGMHGGICGTSDMAFFVSKPPLIGPDEDEVDYLARVAPLRRYLHQVRAISGPFPIEERTSNDGIHFGRLVEFTLVAEVPWVYGVTKELPVPPTVPSVIQDITYNLVSHPSAELASGTVEVARNYVTNPSVETDVSGWSRAVSGAIAIGTVPVPVRSTELAAAGAASAKTTFTAAALSAAPGTFELQQTATLPATVVAGDRYSVNMWAAANTQAGAPVYGALEIFAEWQDAASAVLRVDTVGAIAGGSGVATLNSIAPPVGATKVVMRARQTLASWAAGTIVRLYADALAVTKP
jgi:hypothetical protein